MTMMNTNTNRDEDDTRGGWKQVVSCKATGASSANKTFNSSEKEDGTTSYEVKKGIIEVRFMTASGKSCNISQSLKEFIVSARACTIPGRYLDLISNYEISRS
jgi:hypothetical protein